MAHLSEEDYKELIDYMAEQLHKLQADDVVRQIRELENVSVLEKAGPLKPVDETASDTQAAKSSRRHSAELLPDMNLLETVVEIPAMIEKSSAWLDDTKPKNKKLLKEAVSEFRLRPMTQEEMCRAAVDILESYLVTIPELVALTKKQLKLLPSERVVWADEAARGDEAAPVDIERSVQQAASEGKAKIAERIAALRAGLERSTT